MDYIGRILITYEAVERYRGINLFPAWKIQVSWDDINKSIILGYEPGNHNDIWPWLEINEIININTNAPSNACVLFDQDSIALIFYNKVENKYCKPHLKNGDIFEYGILKSDGFVEN